MHYYGTSKQKLKKTELRDQAMHAVGLNVLRLNYHDFNPERPKKIYEAVDKAIADSRGKDF